MVDVRNKNEYQTIVPIACDQVIHVNACASCAQPGVHRVMISEPRTTAIVKRQDLCTRFDENLSPQNGPLTPGTHHASSSSVISSQYLSLARSSVFLFLSVRPLPFPPSLYCSKENNYGTEGIRTELQLPLLKLPKCAAESSHAGAATNCPG